MGEKWRKSQLFRRKVGLSLREVSFRGKSSLSLGKANFSAEKLDLASEKCLFRGKVVFSAEKLDLTSEKCLFGGKVDFPLEKFTFPRKRHFSEVKSNFSAEKWLFLLQIPSRWIASNCRLCLYCSTHNFLPLITVCQIATMQWITISQWFASFSGYSARNKIRRPLLEVPHLTYRGGKQLKWKLRSCWWRIGYFFAKTFICAEKLSSKFFKNQYFWKMSWKSLYFG